MTKSSPVVYLGTKIISAILMTRKEYNDYRGWELPSDENGSDAGFLVEYKDGGKPNHKNHSGYISWSPKDVFEKSYKQSGQFSFGDAILLLKKGERVARSGWNGKGMFIELRLNTIGINDHFVIKNAQGSFDTWVASVSDSLAEDWSIVSGD